MEDNVIPLVQMFEEAEEASYSERKLNERDQDYYDGKQLTEEERNALKGRGQPPVIYNRIRRKVNFLLGLERQQRRDPKAFPRTPNDEGASQAATDALRYVCDAEAWDEKRSEAWADILVPGTGAILVGHKQDKYGLSPALLNVPWDRFFYDPHSRRSDFSDANYMGIVTWYDVERAKEKWPDSADIITATHNAGDYSETYDDRPKYKVWSDRSRSRVRVVEIFYLKEKQWHRCVFTQSGHLEEPALSPYIDEEGQPENPIKAASLYIDRDNNRYGDVRDMIDPQDEINKRRSKGLHLISQRQARIGPNAQVGVDEVRKELARPDGVILSDDVEILQTNDMAAQNLQLLQEAKAEIDLQGANSALQGKNENDMSGRAILAQQQGGMVEVALHLDRLRTLTLQVYEAIWNRIRQFWNEERWIRISDDERNLKFVGINQPVTAGQMLEEQIKSDPNVQQRIAQDPGAQQRLLMFMGGPQANQVVSMRNVPSEIDVDIVIDEGMDTPTVAAEQWQELAKLAATGVVPIPPELLIEASSLRDKDKLLEKIAKPDEGAAQQQQLAQAGAAAELEKTQSETLKNVADARAKDAKTEIEAFKAGSQAA